LNLGLYANTSRKYLLMLTLQVVGSQSEISLQGLKLQTLSTSTFNESCVGS